MIPNQELDLILTTCTSVDKHDSPLGYLTFALRQANELLAELQYNNRVLTDKAILLNSKIVTAELAERHERFKHQHARLTNKIP